MVGKSKVLTWSRASVRLFHYRDRDQYEVDAILQDNIGQVIGVEVKAAETVRAEDFRGLRLLLSGQRRGPVARRPPSTRMVSPVIQEAASETRNATSAATSSGVPSRPMG